MTPTRSTPLRLTAILALGTALAACNNTANDGVRNGPQAVHPSPSSLAQKDYNAPTANFVPCNDGQADLCPAFVPKDGSLPFDH